MPRQTPSPDKAIRDDLLPASLTTPEPSFIVRKAYSDIVDTSIPARLTTGAPAKDIVETMELVIKAVNNYQTKHNVSTDGRISVTYSDPDSPEQLPVITVALVNREPGGFARRSPSEVPSVRNLRPLVRDETEDKEYPGYRKVVLGFLHDNILRFTCWARTSKAALDRLLWLEDVIEEYTWFLASAGVKRFVYQGNTDRIVSALQNNIVYGYTIDYFVQTERLRVMSEKTLEQLVVTLDVSTA